MSGENIESYVGGFEKGWQACLKDLLKHSEKQLEMCGKSTLCECGHQQEYHDEVECHKCVVLGKKCTEDSSSEQDVLTTIKNYLDKSLPPKNYNMSYSTPEANNAYIDAVHDFRTTLNSLTLKILKNAEDALNEPEEKE